MTSFILQSIHDRASSFPSPISSSSTSRAETAEDGSIRPPGECAFCDIIAGYSDAWKVYEDEVVIAFLDIYPLRQAHTLLVPKSHHARLSDLPQAIGAALGKVMPSVVRAIGDATGNKDLNVVCNQGYAQDVHVHFHLIPAPVFEHEKPIMSYSKIMDRVDTQPKITQPGVAGESDDKRTPAVTALTNKDVKPVQFKSSISPSSPMSHRWIGRKDMYRREELDDDQAKELVENIRSRL